MHLLFCDGNNSSRWVGSFLVYQRNSGFSVTPADYWALYGLQGSYWGLCEEEELRRKHGKCWLGCNSPFVIQLFTCLSGMGSLGFGVLFFQVGLSLFCRSVGGWHI
jgi:hypothetical protein